MVRDRFDWAVPITYAATLLLWTAVVVSAIQFWLGGFGTFGSWLYAWSVPVGVVSLVALPIIAAAEFQKRPFFFVPLDAPTWEFCVFGMSAATVTVVILAVSLGAFVVLPVITPLRLLFSYSLSPGATIASTVAAFPLLWLALSAQFCYLYAFVSKTGLGKIEAEGRVLFSGTVPIYWDLIPAFQFSAATLLNSSATEARAKGACQWVALLQSLVGRVVEIVAIGVGVGLVVNRLAA